LPKGTRGLLQQSRAHERRPHGAGVDDPGPRGGHGRYDGNGQWYASRMCCDNLLQAWSCLLGIQPTTRLRVGTCGIQCLLSHRSGSLLLV